MRNPLHDRPWLLIVGALALFVAAWTVFVVVAQRHRPESVPVISRPPARE